MIVLVLTEIYFTTYDVSGVSITSGTGILTMYINGIGPLTFRWRPTFLIEATFNCVNSSCLPVNNLIANNVSSTFANLTWLAGGTETSWEVMYTDNVSSMGSVVVIDTTYSLTGLNPSTNYDVYVRGICGQGDTSVWSGPISFLTLPQPPFI